MILAATLALTGGSAGAAGRWYAPLLKLPHADLLRAQCIIYRESRSTFAHPNLGDDNGNPGQSGIFQMSNATNGVWDLYALPVLHVVIWKATAYQQALGFMLVWKVDKFGPWHSFDGC